MFVILLENSHEGPRVLTKVRDKRNLQNCVVVAVAISSKCENGTKPRRIVRSTPSVTSIPGHMSQNQFSHFSIDVPIRQ